MNIKFALAKLKYIQAVLILLLAVSAALSQGDAPFSLDASPLPASTGFVNDYTGVIDSVTRLQLETRLREFKEKTGVEIAVAVVKTTGERPIFDYSLAVSRGWKIGSKEDDNPSALLFIAIDDRKYFTQVSRDLEDELPDAAAGSLQRQHLVPEFRKGNYAKGIADTIEAYIRTIEAKRSGAEAPAAGNTDKAGRAGRTSQSSFSVFCCIIVIVLIILSLLSRRGGGKSGNGRGGWGGGGFGGGAGAALPWIIGSILASGSRGSSSGGGGGGSSGGGSDWGGFGGGGDFGGGGAGGDW